MMTLLQYYLWRRTKWFFANYSNSNLLYYKIYATAINIGRSKLLDNKTWPLLWIQPLSWCTGDGINSKNIKHIEGRFLMENWKKNDTDSRHFRIKWRITIWIIPVLKSMKKMPIFSIKNRPSMIWRGG